MKIIELKAENFKKLKAVEIRPEENVIAITGKNEAVSEKERKIAQWDNN